jgi:PAS domain S-box-containing protein
MVARPSLTVARVMTELARALETLEPQPTTDKTIRARAETLFRHAAGVPVALMVVNNSGRYLEVNDHAAWLTGYDRGELLRMSVWDLTPRPSAAAGRRLWRAFIQTGAMAGTYPLCRKDGTRIRAAFRAWANVLPGVHVSALATPALLRRVQPAGRRERRRPRRTSHRD